jgi:hypothetical protein
MMNKFKLRLFLLISLFTCLFARSSGYDINIMLSGCKDRKVYLAKYLFNQQYLVDSCLKVKNGSIHFNGKKELDKGVYTLVSENKSIYFDFFINEKQEFTINADVFDIAKTLSSNDSKENEQFFYYLKFITNKNVEFKNVQDESKRMNRLEGEAYLADKQKFLNSEVNKFQAEFMSNNKGTFLYDVLNLKTEKEPVNTPKAKNGRPDSLYIYYYYKNHYFDGIDFKDERIIRTPFFSHRITRYFETIIVQHPDTIIQELAKLFYKTTQDGLIYNILLGHFTYQYEQSKIMGFDKIFVHLAEKYIISGRANLVYTKETILAIKEQAGKQKHSLLGTQAHDFRGEDVYGAPFSFYNLPGKYSIIKFISSISAKTESLELELIKKTEAEAIKCGIPISVILVYYGDNYREFADFAARKSYKNWSNIIIKKSEKDIIKYYYDLYSNNTTYIVNERKEIVAKKIADNQIKDFLAIIDKDFKPESSANTKKINLKSDFWEKVELPYNTEVKSKENLGSSYATEGIYTVGIDSEVMNSAAEFQKKTSWCWAACIQMVLKYYNVTITQQQIVFKTFGTNDYGDLPNFGGSAYEITRNLNKVDVDNSGVVYKVSASYHISSPKPIFLIQELMNNRPVLISFISGPNTAHAVLITSCTYIMTNNGPQLLTITVRDPWIDYVSKKTYYAKDLSKLILDYWFITVIKKE